MGELKGFVGLKFGLAGTAAWNDREGGRLMPKSSRVFTPRPHGTPFFRRSVRCSWDSSHNLPPKGLNNASHP